MSGWETYDTRILNHGDSKRAMILERNKRRLRDNITDSLSYKSVTIDGEERNVAIIDTEKFDIKTITSLPGEGLTCGGLVHWNDSYWLIIEYDADDTLYARGKIMRCNHLLKWISEDGILHSQWCIIEDATEYMTGEREDRDFVTTKADSRIAMTIAKTDDTVNFGRNMRFLIDEPDASHKASYILTKPLKLGSVFNGHGVYQFILQEVTATADDNHELGIADYYIYNPRTPSESETAEVDVGDGKRRWL